MRTIFRLDITWYTAHRVLHQPHPSTTSIQLRLNPDKIELMWCSPLVVLKHFTNSHRLLLIYFSSTNLCVRHLGDRGRRKRCRPTLLLTYDSSGPFVRNLLTEWCCLCNETATVGITEKLATVRSVPESRQRTKESCARLTNRTTSP